MRLFSSVGLTAIDVSLLGPLFSQSVSTLAVVWNSVVQIRSPGCRVDLLPKTAPATGDGASRTVCEKLNWLVEFAILTNRSRHPDAQYNRGTAHDNGRQATLNHACNDRDFRCHSCSSLLPLSDQQMLPPS